MIHIIFGAAAAGSLKQAIREMKQDQIDDIIAFDDIYSIDHFCIYTNIKDKRTV